MVLLTNARSLFGVWILVLALAVGDAVLAQGVGGAIDHQALQTAQVRMGPKTETADVPFTVDDAGAVEVEVVAPIAGVKLVVRGPGGESVEEGTVSDFQGNFVRFEAREQVEPSSRAIRQLMRVPSLGAGFYSVELSSRRPLTHDIEVTVHVRTNSRVVTRLLPAESEIPLGERVVLTASVLDGDVPVSEASVLVSVSKAGDRPIRFSLFDEGDDGSDKVGDGVYSAAFVPGSAGTYSATAEITGFARSGLAFSRTSVARFAARDTLGELNLRVEGTAVDDDENGLFERLLFNVSANAPAPGRYQVFVRLQTASGRALVSATAVDVEEGWHTSGVAFDAAVLLGSGEPGPYAISSVELLSFGKDGTPQHSSRLADAGHTEPYQLNQFEGFVSPADAPPRPQGTVRQR